MRILMVVLGTTMLTAGAASGAGPAPKPIETRGGLWMDSNSSPAEQAFAGGYIIGSLNAAKLCAPKGMGPGNVINTVTQALSAKPFGDPATVASEQVADLFRDSWKCPPLPSDLDNRNDPIDLGHFRAALAAGGNGRRFAQGFIAAILDTDAAPYGCSLNPSVSLDQATDVVESAAADILNAARVLPTSGSTPVAMVIDESLDDAGDCR